MKIDMRLNKRPIKRDTTTPFTYRVRCSVTNDNYYGVKYAEGCHPDDLWTTYYTSSKYVEALIKEHGIESFGIQIRKIFDTVEEAIKWEQRVNRKVMNWPNFLNRHCGYAFSKESCALGARNFAKMYPEKKSEIGRRAGKKADITHKKNGTGFYDKRICSNGGKIGGRKTANSGRFQTAEWRKLCSRADSIWYTDGKNNERIPKNFTRNFELTHPTWKRGIIRENLQVPDNRGRVYLHHPTENGVKRFIFPDSDIYQDLLKQGYYSKSNHKFA